MLKIQGIETWYGAIQALKGISLDVKQGEIVALLGANGAGKSTTIMTITGILKPYKGKIEFLGQDITGMEAEDDREDRDRLRSGGAAHLPGPLRHGQPDARARRRARRASHGEIRKDLDHVLRDFPSVGGVQRVARAGSCPAASSRCWPSGGG